jgi:hypothetical protein
VPFLRHDEFGPLCANIRQGGWLASLRNAMERDRQYPSTYLSPLSANEVVE